MQKKLRQWTGIPIGVGLGPTKTLAKLANFVAKKRTKTGVFSLCELSIREQLLPTIPVDEVWGIGRCWAAKLSALGITTAAALRDAEPKAIRQVLNVMGERIVYELRGEACLSLEAIAPKQTIMCSRSFGRMVTDQSELLEAIACYAAKAAEKLRGQKSQCGGLHVFLQTNRFQPHVPQYRNSYTWSFLCPTNDSREIIWAAQQCIVSLFRAGFQYQKVGVMLMDIGPDECIQQSLLRSPNYDRSDALMNLVDRLNNQMGSGTIQFAAQGLNRDWQMRQQQRSPRYTTRLSELVQVRC